MKEAWCGDADSAFHADFGTAEPAELITFGDTVAK
jgi:hypothetical protein